jgi:hypothetical protein
LSKMHHGIGALTFFQKRLDIMTTYKIGYCVPVHHIFHICTCRYY